MHWLVYAVSLTPMIMIPPIFINIILTLHHAGSVWKQNRCQGRSKENNGDQRPPLWSSLLMPQWNWWITRAWASSIASGSPSTIDQPSLCRSLVINMYWDENKNLQYPLHWDFWPGLWTKKAFENELFSSGEGRSFIYFIPMPFKTGARIEVINESRQRSGYDILRYRYAILKQWNQDNLYFHGYWH